jgi:hypothetical protein
LPQSQSEYCGVEKNLLLPGIKPGPFSQQPVTILTELSRLRQKNGYGNKITSLKYNKWHYYKNNKAGIEIQTIRMK